MENLEEETFSKLEYFNCKNQDLKDLVELMLGECFVFTVDSLQHYELVEKYRTAQTITNAIFDLLFYQIEEQNEFIKKVYEEQKSVKAEKVIKKEEKSKIETIPFYNEEKHELQMLPVYTSIKMVDGEIV